eukprot:10750229-Alexandrium_andersonii.AAC.1
MRPAAFQVGSPCRLGAPSAQSGMGGVSPPRPMAIMDSPAHRRKRSALDDAYSPSDPPPQERQEVLAVLGDSTATRDEASAATRVVQAAMATGAPIDLATGEPS